MALFQTKSLWVQQLDDDVAAVVLDTPGSHNSLDAEVLADLDQCLGSIVAEPRFRLVVLRSNKASSFCHGTDPLTWAKLTTGDALSAYAAQGQRVCAQLAGMPVPTVAVIEGACLGSGLELALACDYRLVADRPETGLGFTENEQGLLPSFGGIGRVMRLAGLQHALLMLLGGRRVKAREAVRWGLADDVLDANDSQPPLFLREAKKRDWSRFVRRSWRQWLTETTAWGRRVVLRGAERVLRRRLPDDLPAPAEVVQVVRTDLASGLEAGLGAAKEALARVGLSPACRNLARLHELRQHFLPEETGPLQRLGVLGTSSVALQLVLQTVARGRPAVLRVADEMTLGVTALNLVRVLQEDVKRGALSTSDYTKQVNDIRPTVSWKNFNELDLVVDATPGNTEAKRQLFQALEDHVAPTALLVAADPALSVTHLQEGLRQPSRVVGLRFSSFAGRSAAVEVVAGAQTDGKVVQQLREWLKGYGKVGAVVTDSPGGIVLRVWLPGLVEAILLLQEGIPAERIEHAMQRFGMAHSPFEMLDALGLDELLRLAEWTQSVWPNRVADDPLVQAMIGARWLGAKTGIGFQRRRSGTTTLNPGLGRLVARLSKSSFEPQSTAEQTRHIQGRLVDPMIKEARRCVAEHIVGSADELDLALMLTGWAPHRGGPIRFGEAVNE